MAEQITITQETIDELMKRIDALQKQAQPSGSLWNKPQAQTEPESVSVPVSIQTATGKVRLYLTFKGITTPEQITALLNTLIDQGVPVDAWKQDAWQGGSRWKR